MVLPYQLGYHPGPSVVLTVLHDKRLGLVQRHDLIADPEHCREAAQRAISIAERESATSLIVLAHEDTEGESAPLSEAMVAAAAAKGIPVHERVVVRAGRWFSPDCRDSCCPEAGRVLPRPEDVPAVAAFVHAGVAPLPSREALVQGVLPERDAQRARSVGLHLASLGQATSTRTFGGGSSVPQPVECWLDRGEDVLRWWTLLLDPRPDAIPVADLTDEAIAWLAISLRDVIWRDALMGILAPGSLSAAVQVGDSAELAAIAATRCPWVPDVASWWDDEEDLARAAEAVDEWHEEVLAVRSRCIELTRLLPAGATPSVLTLVAHLAWWTGDGTVAGICLEQALEIDPGHRLAGLMMRLLSFGVRPWPERPSAGPRAVA